MEGLISSIKEAIPDADIDFTNISWDGIKNGKIFGLKCNKHPNPKKPWEPVYNNIIRLHTGCPSCANDIKKKRMLETYDFVGRSKSKHGTDRFDYSKLEYKGHKESIILICNIHDLDFECTPPEHLSSRGGCCPSCRQENTTGENHPLSVDLEELKKRIEKIWGNRFQYDFTGYTCLKDKIKITCNKCKRTWPASATNHVHPTDPRGCRACGRKETGDKLRMPLEDFISKSNKIHNHIYDYNNFTYVNNSTKGYVTCKVHGDYLVTPADHFSGSGCPSCSLAGVSRGQIEWLNYQATLTTYPIIYKGGAHNKEETFRFNGKLYRVDGYCEETKTIYEFLGCWYHGCNKCGKFDENNIHCWKNMTYKELFDEFQQRKNVFEDNGYTVVFIWECDWEIQKNN